MTRLLDGPLSVLKSRTNGFLIAMAVAFLLPAVLPSMSLDYPYFFILVIVLMAWFIMKWDSYRAIELKSGRVEVILGLAIVAAVYAENAILAKSVGLIDLTLIFSALVIAFFGLRAFKFFWVPVAYGLVLLLGYQIENSIPNYVALQDWMAGVMASSMNFLGVSASVSGHVVALNTGTSTLLLSVEGDCTGIQGILAFGMLSTMALLDMKPKISRLIPLFVIGFAGAFLINILRLIVVFLTFEFLGVDAGTTMHVYFGYVIFIAWVMVFWALAFRYLAPRPAAGPSPTPISLRP
jgi:exosortase